MKRQKKNDSDSPEFRFPPGYYLNEILEDSHIPRKEFAAKLGIPPDQLDALLDGELPLSKETAEKLAKEFNLSVELWQNLESEYQRIRAAHPRFTEN